MCDIFLLLIFCIYSQEQINKLWATIWTFYHTFGKKIYSWKILQTRSSLSCENLKRGANYENIRRFWSVLLKEVVMELLITGSVSLAHHLKGQWRACDVHMWWEKGRSPVLDSVVFFFFLTVLSQYHQWTKLLTLRGTIE